MGFYDKIKWMLGILLVFSLIIMTNLIDRNNFKRVRDSVVTIYEDRLLAKGLIFEMYTLVHEKELALALSDASFYNQRNIAVDGAIEDLVTQFEFTKLTNQEGKVLIALKESLGALKKAEFSSLPAASEERQKLSSQISDIKTLLYDLSEIQLEEGRKQMSISRRALDTVELFTQIEIYLLVFLAIVVQVIVMYSPKKAKRE